MFWISGTAERSLGDTASGSLRRCPAVMAGSSPRASRQSAAGPNPWVVERDALYSAPSSSKEAVSESAVRATSGDNACCFITSPTPLMGHDTTMPKQGCARISAGASVAPSKNSSSAHGF